MKTNAVNRERNQKFVYNYLLDHPCVTCGENDPIVLEFDHIDQSTKTDEVCNMVKQSSAIETIANEISKCRVLCCNCHRRHTYHQLGHTSKSF
jgi:acetate kinase